MDALWMTLASWATCSRRDQGSRGFRSTRSVTDRMAAGRRTHPYAMAMSCGAAFISASAIVGFGGTAGAPGMGLWCLTCLSILFGILGLPPTAIAAVLVSVMTKEFGGNHLEVCFGW